MKKLLLSFLNEIKSLDEKEHSEKFIEYLLSPVITGIKPSSTITLKHCKRKLYAYWQEYGEEILNRYKLDSIILKETEEAIVLLVYDKKNLHQHLNLDNNCKLLSEFGYKDVKKLEKCLQCLKNRAKNGDFPHESGIFLGIPYEDVLGFINGDKCLESGYWKVYTDKYMHSEIFNLYDKSRELYILNSFEENKDNLKDVYVDYRRNLYHYDS